jgi:hypothetical protein
MAIILVLTATADEIGLDYETKGRIGKRTDRYAGYIEDKLVSLRETQKCLEEACERAFSGF